MIGDEPGNARQYPDASEQAVCARRRRSPAYRFYLLYDKVCREDILRHAYALAKANDGAPGVDGETFADIELAGRGEMAGRAAR